VISLISVTGVGSYYLSGQPFSWETTALFLFGGFVGMWLGGIVAKKIKGATLQRLFAAAVVGVAIFVIVKSVV